MIRLVDNGLSEIGVSHTYQQAELLLHYMELLFEANQRINLTAIDDAEAAVRLHLLDSATLLSVCPPEKGDTLIDVGTGGGLPGMVIGILRPDLRVTLCDATRKKVDYLKETIAALGIGDHVTAIQGRAEEMGRNPKYRDQFDYVTARAVAPMDQLAEYCLPLTRPGGYFVAMKGRRGEEELEQARGAISALGGSKPMVYPSPITDTQCCLIRVKKWRNTPKEYPRASGAIRKHPIMRRPGEEA